MRRGVPARRADTSLQLAVGTSNQTQEPDINQTPRAQASIQALMLLTFRSTAAAVELVEASGAQAVLAAVSDWEIILESAEVVVL